MDRILALGAPEFVRVMQMGGAHARLADAQNISHILEEVLKEKNLGIVIVETALASAIPPSVAQKMLSKGKPRLLLLERRSAELLRGRIRQVVGADLMESSKKIGGRKHVGIPSPEC